MKIVSILLVGLLIFLPQLLWAGDYYTTTTTANVRTGKGIEYPVSFTLSEGEEVEVLSKSSSYYEIRYLKKTGYIYAGYLQYSRSENSLPGLKSLLLYVGLILSLVLFGGYVVVKRIRRKNLLETVTISTRGTKTERDLVLLKENEQVHYNEAEVFRVLKDAFANGASEDIERQHRERIKDMIGKHRIFE